MRNRILVKVMEGIMSEGWFMVNIKKIIGGLGFYNNCYKIKRFDSYYSLQVVKNRNKQAMQES